jgi:hypothetical protein
MNRRIMMWGLLGLSVAFSWALIGIFAGPDFNVGRSTLAAVTAPVSLLGRKMPLGVEASILLNGCIYALLGLVIETTRRVLARSQYCISLLRQ